MRASNYPPGVTGLEPQIAGYGEYEFVCPTCDEELVFSGTKWDAWATCPTCGEVNVDPSDLWESEAAEQANDQRRDEGR